MARKKTFKSYLKKRLKDPGFKAHYEEEVRKLEIGIQIAEARKKKGLTQQELAELIGSSQGQVTRLETGTYTGYTVQTLQKIADALGGRLTIELAV